MACPPPAVHQRDGRTSRQVTSVLRALADTGKIHKHGFYHDGRFASLRAVVDDYDTVLKLGLSNQDKTNLIEYLKSI